MVRAPPAVVVAVWVWVSSAVRVTVPISVPVASTVAVSVTGTDDVTIMNVAVSDSVSNAVWVTVFPVWTPVPLAVCVWVASAVRVTVMPTSVPVPTAVWVTVTSTERVKVPVVVSVEACEVAADAALVDDPVDCVLELVDPTAVAALALLLDEALALLDDALPPSWPVAPLQA